MTRRSERPQWADATDPGHARGRWRLRNWRLPTKLLAVLLIPSFAAVGLVGLRVKADLDTANRFAEGAARVRVDATVAALVHELQRERDITVRYNGGAGPDDQDELRQQRDRVDAAIGDFHRAHLGAGAELSSKAVDGFQRMEHRLAGLTELRYAGQSASFPADAVLRSYSGLLSNLLDIGDRAASDATDGELTRTWLAANALARLKDRLSVRRAVVADALAHGSLSQDGERLLLGAEAELAAARDDFMKFATPLQQRTYTDTVVGSAVDTGEGMVESVLTRAGDGNDLAGLDPRRWDVAATDTVNLVKEVQDALLVQIQQRSDTLAADARRSAAIDAGIVVGALVVAAVLASVIARSLLRPLRILRRSALEVAEHKLPAAVDDILADPDPRPEAARRRAVEPVPVFTREELGQVARAFDAVHGEAVRLAGEQAMLRENINSMFVNLSRRSQDLVERQLTVLDRMEEHEQDPDILDGLFELDHLATRMRRNSENLLVLAGQDAGRPLPEAVAAQEIVGAALSEVEHYQRIEVTATPNLAVRGEAVSDLVHVIAELFDNATRYSRDVDPVSVVSSVTPAGAWRIDITDRGAGMPDTEIRRANARLAELPEVNVEVSRRMGLYVVARLTRRHEIRVRLEAADDLRGLTAIVEVPVALIEPGEPARVALPPLSQASVQPPEPRPHQRHPQREPTGEYAPPRAPVDGWAEPEFAEPDLAVPGYSEHDSAEPDHSMRDYSMPDYSMPDYSTHDVAEHDYSAPEHGPRRAPVVWQSPPDWPTEDDDERSHPLGDETPTDRMPAYQEVLSQWFQAREAPPADDVAWPAQDDEAHVLSRSPGAVRARMVSLQNRARRGRHSRTD